MPLLALAGAVVVQVGMVVNAWSAAHEAAKAGARAIMVNAPPAAAARRVLGQRLASGSSVRVVTDGDGVKHVDVRVVVPMVLPWLPAPHVASAAEVLR